MSDLAIERLDEKALRRPTFRMGWPVVLADGQAWSIGRPIIRFSPVPSKNGDEPDYRAVYRLDGSSRYSQLMRDYDEMMENKESTIKQYINCHFALALEVLLVNYDLTNEQACSLLEFNYQPDAEQVDPEGFRMREEVMMVARGQGPKQWAGGESSTLTPPA